MARSLRVDYPGALHHVTARGNGRTEIFVDDVDRELFLATLGRACERYGTRIHTYCLMSNHYHLLTETTRASLARAMRHLNGVYAQTFNRRHCRPGHLFQGRYKAILIEREPHLLELVRYIVLNPVRAGLVQRAEEWVWSSHRAGAGLDPSPSFLDLAWIHGQFAPDLSHAQARYRAFVEDSPSRTPWAQLRGQVFLGSETFARSHHPGPGLPADIPLAQRRPAPPDLRDILQREGERGIATAYRQHGYHLREIAAVLNVHPATVSKRLSRLENTP
jgi:REP element-mobilizing transposase RayT